MQITSTHEAFAQARAALIEAARDRLLLTYPDVAATMGLPGSGQDMGRKIGAMGDASKRAFYESERDAVFQEWAPLPRRGDESPYLVADQWFAHAVTRF